MRNKATVNVNPEKRAVSAVMTNHDDIITEIARYYGKDLGWIMCLYSGVVNPRVFEDKKYMDVARCSDEDVWDEKIGKILARARCEKQYHKEMYKDYMEVFNLLCKAREAIVRFADFHYNQMCKDEESINYALYLAENSKENKE